MNVSSLQDLYQMCLQMNPSEFELFVAKVFSQLGLEVGVTQESRDRGTDIVGKAGKQVIGIQAKRYSKNSLVTGPDIQQYAGVKAQHGFDQFMVVCSSGFTAPAIENAENLSIDLIDMQGLYELLERDKPIVEVSETSKKADQNKLSEGNSRDTVLHSFSGPSQTATEAFNLYGGLTFISYKHQGERNLMANLVSIESGEKILAINALHDRKGGTALNVSEGEYALNVRIGENWEVDVKQPKYSEEDIGDTPVEVQAVGNKVIGPIEFDATARIEIEAEGEGNILVELMNLDGKRIDYLINEIAPCEASSLFNHSGIALISVDTRADWEMSVEKM